MSPRGEGTICSHAAIVSPALVLLLFPLEVLQVVAWTWLAAAAVLLLILTVALVVRSLILPYTDPELYRLITKQRAKLTIHPRS